MKEKIFKFLFPSLYDTIYFEGYTDGSNDTTKVIEAIKGGKFFAKDKFINIEKPDKNDPEYKIQDVYN